MQQGTAVQQSTALTAANTCWFGLTAFFPCILPQHCTFQTDNVTGCQWRREISCHLQKLQQLEVSRPDHLQLLWFTLQINSVYLKISYLRR